MLSLMLQATLQKTKLFSMLSLLCWDKIPQVTEKTVCNFVQDAPYNIAKILFDVVVTLLGQYCRGKNPVQCCLRDSTENCTGKNPVQCRLNWLFYFGLVIFFIITCCCKCCSNAKIFTDIGQNTFQANIEQKDKILRNNNTRSDWQLRLWGVVIICFLLLLFFIILGNLYC